MQFGFIILINLYILSSIKKHTFQEMDVLVLAPLIDDFLGPAQGAWSVNQWPLLACLGTAGPMVLPLCEVDDQYSYVRALT